MVVVVIFVQERSRRGVEKRSAKGKTGMKIEGGGDGCEGRGGERERENEMSTTPCD
jgi:hypothetical protein